MQTGTAGRRRTLKPRCAPPWAPKRSSGSTRGSRATTPTVTWTISPASRDPPASSAKCLPARTTPTPPCSRPPIVPFKPRQTPRGDRSKSSGSPAPAAFSTRMARSPPASHLNFVIANGVVVVPVFGTNTQVEALRRLQAVFPDRKVVGLPAFGLLGAGDAGGGAFHCITREEPVFAQRSFGSR